MAEAMQVQVDAGQRCVLFPVPIQRIEWFQLKIIVAEIIKAEARMEQAAQVKAGLIEPAPAGVLGPDGRLRT